MATYDDVIPQSLMIRVERIVEELIEKAREHFKLKIPDLTIDYSLKGRCAGQYQSRVCKGLIKINKVLLLEYTEEMVENTVPHEVAHHVAHFVFGPSCSHDWRWGKVMRLFGVEATRCHNYDTTNAAVRKARRISYSCSCGISHNITMQKHNRILRGARYRCRACKTTIQLTAVQHNNLNKVDTIMAKKTAKQMKHAKKQQLKKKTAKKSTKTPSKKGTKKVASKKQGIGAEIMKLIGEAKNNDAIVKAIHKKFSGANTTASNVSWYRSKMRSEGKKVPNPK